MTVTISASPFPISLESANVLDSYKNELAAFLELGQDFKVSRSSLVPKTSTWTNGDPNITNANAVFSCIYTNQRTKQVHFLLSYLKIDTLL